MTNKLLMAATIALSACASTEPVTRTADSVDSPAASPSITTQAPAQSALVRVDPSQVCMINNQYMGKPQIPVVVGDKTYFGCCDMCKARLTQDAQSRAASDPVSGARVDKAAAVIGKDASGSVFYFENEVNLRRYASR